MVRDAAELQWPHATASSLVAKISADNAKKPLTPVASPLSTASQLPREGFMFATNLLTATRKIAENQANFDNPAVNPCVSGSKPGQAPERDSSSNQVCCNNDHRGNLHGH